MKLRTDKKTITLFGRAIPITLIVALMVIGIGSAALITSYFTISSSVEVSNPISIDVGATIPVTANVGGITETEIPVLNTGDMPILVELDVNGVESPSTVTFYTDGKILSNLDANENDMPELVIMPGGADVIMKITWGDITPGVYSITVTAVPVTTESNLALLILEDKDANNNYLKGVGTPQGYVLYTKEDAKFTFRAKAVDMTPGTEYALIYYADSSTDRFTNWGGRVTDGAGAGVVITTGMSDTSGKLIIDTLLDEGIETGDIPAADDGNRFAYDYRSAPDYYSNAQGAKLWIVPASQTLNYEEQGIKPNWTPSAYLFETDLINYIQP